MSYSCSVVSMSQLTLLSVKLSDFTQLLFVNYSFLLNALCLSFLSVSHYHDKQQIDPDSFKIMKLV